MDDTKLVVSQRQARFSWTPSKARTVTSVKSRDAEYATSLSRENLSHLRTERHGKLCPIELPI